MFFHDAFVFHKKKDCGKARYDQTYILLLATHQPLLHPKQKLIEAGLTGQRGRVDKFKQHSVGFKINRRKKSQAPSLRLHEANLLF